MIPPESDISQRVKKTGGNQEVSARGCINQMSSSQLWAATRTKIFEVVPAVTVAVTL